MKKQYSTGFTLPEVMVVIVITGILTAIALPKVFGSIAKAKSAEVPVAAGTYIKHQDAAIAEHGAIGNWKTIGYMAPGNNGTTAYFQYSEGELTDNYTSLDKLGDGKIGWQATNLSSLNSCNTGNWWTIKISQLSNQQANYNAQVNSSQCISLASNFSVGNTTGTGNLVPGGLSNVIILGDNSTSSNNNKNTSSETGNAANNSSLIVSGTTDAPDYNTSNTATNNSTSYVTLPSASGLANTVLGALGIGSSSQPTGSTSEVASETTNVTESASNSETGSTGTTTSGESGSTGSSGGSGGSGGSTTASGVASGTGTNNTGSTSNDVTTINSTSNSEEVKDPSKTETAELFEGTLELKSGGWNGDGFRNHPGNLDSGMVNFNTSITAGVLYTYNTGTTDPGKEGLYKLETNSTYTFTLTTEDVQWGNSNWIQTEIRVYTESNFTAKVNQSSGPAAVMCGTTQKTEAAIKEDYAKNGVWSTTGYNTSSSPKGFTATGTYDATTKTTTFTITTGNEVGYFGANFRMNGSHGALGSASETIQQQVQEALKKATLTKSE